MLSSLLLASCGVLEEKKTDASKNTLVAVSDEPAAANCTAGGKRIDSGLDNGDGGGTAGDGVLQAGEVDATEFVCNGDSGIAILVSATPEEVGNNCAAGGTRVDVGLDNGEGAGTAGDGVLQSDEVDNTSFVCNDPSFGLLSRPTHGLIAPDAPPTTAAIGLADAYPNIAFDFPVTLTHPPGDDSRWYILEQEGRVFSFANDPDVEDVTLAIDITDKIAGIEAHNEAGLMGMAFHPDFASNRQAFLFYTDYSDEGPSGIRVVVSRFTFDAEGLVMDPASEEVILTEAEMLTGAHHAGTLEFGPDGYLYISLGDGGHITSTHAQDVTTKLGAILRIDVDGTSAFGNYGIPADNPFADGADGRPEIFAWGFRNPWKLTFDKETGDVWVGDVGQKAWEEVDLVVNGGNYGWIVMEGNHCYDGAECDPSPYIPPVAEYAYLEGICNAVTGGYVYRGSAIPDLQGVYLYADHCRGLIWGLFNDEEGELGPELLLEPSPSPRISTFAQDAAGELYVVDRGPGIVYRIVSDAPVSANPLPDVLSETGFVDADQPSRPPAGAIPYEVNVPFWSDGATKERWMIVPDGATVTIGEDGDWDFPIGTVFVKNFYRDGAIFETRLFMRHPSGAWAGYSYEWKADGSDAVLLATAKRTTIAGETWDFPSRAGCMQCHTAAAGFVLGLETGQMNRPFTYSATGITANQLSTLNHIGLFSEALEAEPSQLPKAPDLADSTHAVGLRARTYLQVNCSFCHRPGGSGGGLADFRLSDGAADLGVCNVAPQEGDLGVSGAKLLVPGAAGSSLISLRVHSLEPNERMPPLASNMVDQAGAALLDAWIDGLAGCP